MTPVAAAWTAALAAWLLIPSRRSRLVARRGVAPPAWLRGNPSAPPLARRAGLGVMAGSLAGVLIGGWPGAVVAGLVAVGATVGLGRLGRRDDTREVRAELPDALDFLAACLEAGLPTGQAVAAVIEVSPRATARLLVVVDAALSAGRAGAEAWGLLRGHAVWGRAAADIAGSEHRGTSLAGLLRAHAEDARQDEADATLRRARTVGVRSVIPLMVCFLPAFVLVGIVPIIAGLLADLLE